MTSFCPWAKAAYFIYSSNVPTLLYYSHAPAIIVSLIVGLLVYRSERNNLIGKVLLGLFLMFSLWAFIDIILWSTNDPRMVMAFWSIQIIVEIGVFILSLYLVKVYVGEAILSNKVILFLTSLTVPILVLVPTVYTISGVNLADCTAVESKLIIYLTYLVEIFISIWIIKLLAKYARHNTRAREIKFFTVGITLFLLAFSFGNIVGSFTEDWTVAQYGLLGMPIFVGLLTYIIVKYQTFNSKLLATEALVWSLGILVGTQFLFITENVSYILTGITVVIVIIFGRILIQSVKREVEQRERLEVLRVALEETNTKLEGANDKLQDLDKLKNEFLSLGSPLTAIKGYASMVLEGDYGEVNPEAKEAIDRIFQSSQNLAKVVEDLLNVSKIEQGGMKYEMAPFSVAEVASDMAKDLSITAEKRGLKMTYEGDDTAVCMANGDKEKIRQVVLNFIDNSIKYTKEGSIHVSVRRIDTKVVFAVSDTGMGMTQEIMDSLFQKFSRGDGARMNTGGSGLGLYLAKEIVEAHKGKVFLKSDGPGKGSTFGMEIDAI
jgi:signal transduction histidine kinase